MRNSVGCRSDELTGWAIALPVFRPSLIFGPMMNRRRLLLILLVAAVTVSLVGLSVYWLMPSRPGVSGDNFRRVRRGMTREQVETLFGSKGRPLSSEPIMSLTAWRGAEGEAVIEFWESPEVVESGWFKMADGRAESLYSPPQGLEGWMRKWTGW
jgi:hypothetical protein